jgi:hypothetical protein
MKNYILILLMTLPLLSHSQISVKTDRDTHKLETPNIATFDKGQIVKAGEIITLLDFYNDGYFTALHDADTFYLYYPYIDESADVAEFKRQRLEANTSPRPYIEPVRLTRLKRIFGERNGRRVFNGEIWIGMSDAMARSSVGQPKNINSTVTANRKSEQWVYETRYLYFDNSELTAIQERK